MGGALLSNELNIEKKKNFEIKHNSRDKVKTIRLHEPSIEIRE